jgi:hypothetical protein
MFIGFNACSVKRSGDRGSFLLISRISKRLPIFLPLPDRFSHKQSSSLWLDNCCVHIEPSFVNDIVLDGNHNIDPPRDILMICPIAKNRPGPCLIMTSVVPGFGMSFLSPYKDSMGMVEGIVDLQDLIH